MSVDTKLLDSLVGESFVNYVLDLDGQRYRITQTTIDNVPTPMNRPANRGGVYFTDKTAYQMRGLITELKILSKLSSKMLGPNTEFEELHIIANTGDSQVHIYAYLTNMIQTPADIQLNMMIVRVC